MIQKINNIFLVTMILILIVTTSSLLAEKKLNVVVSIPPQKIFVSEIGRHLVDVSVLVGEGQSPATYDPSPAQIAKLSEADIYFRTGVPFENRLISKIEQIFPELKIVDLRDGVKLREISGHDHDGHHHGATDPHIWMDPILVKTQLKTIYRYLLNLRPEQDSVLSANLLRFSTHLDHIDMTTSEVLKNLKNRDFFIFHPTLGYFADRYRLNQIPIEYEGKEPGAKYISKLIEIAKNKSVKIILTQPQFSDKSAKVIAKAIGAEVKEINHLPGSFVDYIHNLTLIAEILSGTGPKKMP